MWVKILLILFLVPSACFAVEVNKEKFNQMIEREVLECRESERLLMDPMDVNTFYWCSLRR